MCDVVSSRSLGMTVKDISPTKCQTRLQLGPEINKQTKCDLANGRTRQKKKRWQTCTRMSDRSSKLKMIGLGNYEKAP